MARHSKWHKVRQFKGAIDAKRAASFTKLAREITVAVREKGTDPAMNVRLRIAVERAKKASMPKDNIERAIERGAGTGGEGAMEPLRYEAYGPGGMGMIIECLTGNRNRTVNDVKHLLSKNGGSLAQAGAVEYLFDRKGVIHAMTDVTESEREALELLLIDSGAEDFYFEDGELEILTMPEMLGSVINAAERAGCRIENAQMEWIPKSTIEIDPTVRENLEMLIEQLEALDDVSDVFTNLA